MACPTAASRLIQLETAFGFDTKSLRGHRKLLMTEFAYFSSAPPNPATVVKAFISVSPFGYRVLDEPIDGPPPEQVAALLRNHVGRDYRLAASGRQALDLILAALNLAPDDVISIITTSGSDYVSNCVTSTVELHCRWSMKLESATRAVIAIHEWGRPCERIVEVQGQGIPVIEDCAYAFATRYADGSKVGSKGDYALFSLSKMFSVNFGGVLVAPDGELPLAPLCQEHEADLLTRIGPELSRLPEVVSARRAVWSDLAERFSDLGAPPYFDPMPGEEPSVLMFHHDPARVPLAEVRKRFDQHGIEASIFYGSDAFYVPAHQRLGPASRAFMAEIYRSLLADWNER